MRSGFCLFLFFVFSKAVFSQSGATISDSVLTEGKYRKFHVYVPTSYNDTAKFPLVINLHGLGSSGIQQQVYGNFMRIADTANFLIVHPEGTNVGTAQYWNVGLSLVPNDISFMRDLIDTLAKRYKVDEDAVYSCGMSNGGILSFYLACHLPNKIAAIASVTGTMLRTWYQGCSPKSVVPVLMAHGTLDDVVPYNGNSTGTTAGLFMPIDTVIQRWVFHNRCVSAPTVSNVPNLSTMDGSSVQHFKYTGGVDGSIVELFKVNGGGHSWPGAVPIFPLTNQDFDASIEIWRFFRQYKLSQFTTNVGLINETELTSNIFLYPNPSADYLRVEGGENAAYSVYSIYGQEVPLTVSDAGIDIRSLAEGVYFLKIEVGNVSVLKKFVKN